MKKSVILLLAASIIALLVWLAAALTSSLIIGWLGYLFLPETSMLLFVISFFLKLGELPDNGQPGKTLWRFKSARRMPLYVLTASIVLFALNFVATAATRYEIEVNWSFVFFPYMSILLGIISVFLKLNFVDRGSKIINRHLEM